MTDNNELESLRAEVRALLGEMAKWRKDDTRREQQLQLLFENVRDLATVYQKLAVGLDAITNAVQLMSRRN